MKLQLVSAALVAAALTLAACGEDATTTNGEDGAATSSSTGQSEEASEAGESQRLWIAAELADCEGVGPQKCMQIAESEDGDYEFFYDQIEGFSFEEGSSYVIDVIIEEVEDPPADGSSLRYTLVEIIEQTATPGPTTSSTTATTAEPTTSSTASTSTTTTSASTSAAAEATRLWIGSEHLECEGVGPQTCLQVATSQDGDYEFFYDQIEGFDPEIGTAYVIDVTIENVEDPPADGSSKRYILVEVIEQTEATE